MPRPKESKCDPANKDVFDPNREFDPEKDERLKDEPLKDERPKVDPLIRELAKPDAALVVLEPPKERQPPFEVPLLCAEKLEFAKPPELRPPLK